jgi:2-polyprenyl-6-hydroxyphenyl methylase/3-demethylubiquinone-9 3-methyltransferase
MKSWEEAYKTLQNSSEWNELEKYLRDFNENNIPTVEDIWKIMNQVWDDMGLDSKNYNSEQLSRYYSHPVWFLNGLFIEIDRESMRHRKSIAGYFKNKENLKILDYGGGFGTLAKEIAKITPSSKVDIYEPYASKYAHENIQDFKNIKIVNNLKENYYNVLVNTDILEHVEKPIELIAIYNKCLRKGGILISHWNFTPCIKCHLPKHFHLRYTFDRIVPLLGFTKEIKNERHGHYFLKVKNITKEDLNNAYKKEKVSKLFYPLNETIEETKRIIVIILKKLAMYDLVKRVIRK